MRTARVSGHADLVRDLSTGAVLVGSGSQEYLDYRRKITARDRILRLEREVGELKGMLGDVLSELRKRDVQGS